MPEGKASNGEETVIVGDFQQDDAMLLAEVTLALIVALPLPEL